jgi:hypothetical protein
VNLHPKIHLCIKSSSRPAKPLANRAHLWIALRENVWIDKNTRPAIFHPYCIRWFLLARAPGPYTCPSTLQHHLPIPIHLSNAIPYDIHRIVPVKHLIHRPLHGKDLGDFGRTSFSTRFDGRTGLILKFCLPCLSKATP